MELIHDKQLDGQIATQILSEVNEKPYGQTRHWVKLLTEQSKQLEEGVHYRHWPFDRNWLL